MKALSLMFKLFGNALVATAKHRHFNAPTSKRRSQRRGTTYKGTPHQRLAPAIVGGNWQGVEYLTYAEHDRLVMQAKLLNAPYSVLRANYIASRSH